MTDIFWQVFAAVLGANMLTGCFFWGLIAYHRHELNGTAGSKKSHLPLMAILMPMAFAILGTYVAFGGH